MSLQARYSFYTKLYKKYSPDLSDEEIGQEVRNLSHAENQQESIDNFYKNVVGKPVTADQRIKISQFVDPQATKGIIDNENAKIKADNEALKLKNKEDVAARTKELEKSIKEFTKSFGDVFKRPDFWGGYQLVPEKFEFWQGRESRLNDRIEYRLENGEWHFHRLAP